jgi:DNA repair protein RecO (recombination protein O)
MLQLSRFLGFYPQGNHSGDYSIFDLQEGRFVNFLPNHLHYLKSQNSKLLNDFLVADYAGALQLTLDKVQRKQLLNALILFYQLHISTFKEIKSHQILEEVII